MKEHFLGQAFFALPEIASIHDLFERAKSGLVFFGETKKLSAEKLKVLTSLSHFDQLITLLQVFNLLAESKETIALNTRPIANVSVLKEQERLHRIYHFIEEHYEQHIDVNAVTKISNLTTGAFYRYFKKSTHLTFTDFLNQYRINQAKKLLMQDKNVSDACYETGFENLSHFIKTFKKFTGENPSAFRRKQALYK